MRRLVFLILAITILALSGLWVAHLNREREEESARREAIAETFRVMKERAESGELEAQLILADWLRTGTNTVPDPISAIELYRRAAREGSAEAARRIGTMYETGDGVVLDYLRAADWYRVSVNLGGTPEAFFKLGWLSLYGRGVAHDLRTAVDWFERAAKDGHGVARYLLGAIHDEGWGIQPDVVKAYAWYTEALRQRDAILAFNAKFDPRTARERLAKRMNSQQIREGEAMARGDMR